MRVTEHKRRASKRVKRALVALCVASAPAVGAAFTHSVGLGMGALVTLLVSAIALARRAVGKPRELGRDGRIEDGALLVGDERFDELAFGHSIGRTTLLLGLHDGRELTVALPVHDADEPMRVLTALGVGPGARRTEFTIDSPIHVSGRAGGGWRTCALFVIVVIPLMLLTLLGILGAAVAEVARQGFDVPATIGTVAFLLLAAMLFAPWLAAIRASSSRQLTVGADGIRIPATVGDRFIPLSRIDRVEGEQLVLADGRRVRIFSDPLTPDKLRVLAALARRIDTEAQARREPPERIDTGVLARAGRSREQWREELEREAQREARYREAGIESDDFVMVAADGTKPPDVRVGAAFAAAACGGPETIAKLRIAAQASADGDLRRALEQAAEGELAASLVERSEQRRRSTR